MALDDAQRILASLPLQMLIYFNTWFVGVYFIASLLLFIYKSYTFPYPESALGWEIAMLFLYVFVEMARIFLASQGNKKEEISPLVWAAGFAVPVLVANVYFLEWQTFVLRADFLLNAISFVFVGLELLFSMFTAVSFCNHHRF